MKKNRGFTLVELLVVIGLIALLAGILGSNLQGIFRASGVSEAVAQLDNDLSLARQAASVKNREYEVRFLSFSDKNAARSESSYRGYQILVREPVTDPAAEAYTRPNTEEFDPPAIAIHAVRELPGSVIFFENEERSNLLTDASRQPIETSVEIGDEVVASYRYFRFKPDGSTDLAKGERWFVSIANEDSALQGDLSNLATLEIDPLTGKLKWHRP